MSDRLQLIRESTEKMAGHSSLEDAYSDRAWLLHQYDALVSRLEERQKHIDALEQRLDRACAERDQRGFRLDPALELCREIEFFLRGHPGEASVLRAKINAFLVERPSGGSVLDRIAELQAEIEEVVHKNITFSVVEKQEIKS